MEEDRWHVPPYFGRTVLSVEKLSSHRKSIRYDLSGAQRIPLTARIDR
jgi:hypothetical protein